MNTIATLACLTVTPLPAGGWILNADASHLAFGSIKKNMIGEVHSFESISGTVSKTGAAEIEINLASVQTYIDIRNERMIEHVFKYAPNATISAALVMDALNALAVGDSVVMDVEAVLSLLGVETEFFAELFVMRAGEGNVLVTKMT